MHKHTRLKINLKHKKEKLAFVILMYIHSLQITLDGTSATKSNVKIIMDFGQHVKILQSLMEKPLSSKPE